MRSIWIPELGRELGFILERELEAQRVFDGLLGVETAYPLALADALGVDGVTIGGSVFLWGDDPRARAVAAADADAAIERAEIERVIAWHRAIDDADDDARERLEAKRDEMMGPIRKVVDELAKLPTSNATFPRGPFGVVLRCRHCGAVVTKPVERVSSERARVPEPGREMLGPIEFTIVDDTIPARDRHPYGLVPGAFVASNPALVNTTNVREKNVPDCCGFRADEGPNQRCACGRMIASYWCAESSGDFVVFSPDAVVCTPTSELSPSALADVYAHPGYGDS